MSLCVADAEIGARFRTRMLKNSDRLLAYSGCFGGGKKQPVCHPFNNWSEKLKYPLRNEKVKTLCFKDPTLLNTARISDAMSVKPLPLVLNIKQKSNSGRLSSDIDVPEMSWEDDSL